MYFKLEIINLKWTGCKKFMVLNFNSLNFIMIQISISFDLFRMIYIYGLYWLIALINLILCVIH